MRRIDIFISSPSDVQQERSVVERLIRSIAIEFKIPVSISHPNRRRKLKPLNGETVPLLHGHDLLCPSFWEYQDFVPGQEYRERIPNTGQYDLVICILHSRLGNQISPAFVLPDRAQPTSSTEYEIAWALDQINRTPASPKLHVYRNLSASIASLEALEEREAALRRQDSVREFFSSWMTKTAFSEALSDYQDLQEFENLFRNDFRNFVTQKLDREMVYPKPDELFQPITRTAPIASPYGRRHSLLNLGDLRATFSSAALRPLARICSKLKAAIWQEHIRTEETEVTEEVRETSVGIIPIGLQSVPFSGR